MLAALLLSLLAATSWADGSVAGSAALPLTNAVALREITVLNKTVVFQGDARAPAPAVPASLRAAPNLTLWLYDPRSNGPLATGIYLRDLSKNGDWQFMGAGFDGSLYLNLAAGSYLFDTVEPNNTESILQRHRYQVTVSAAGAATLEGETANGNGVYVVTLNKTRVAANPQVQQAQERLIALASEPASTFVPTSQCQMMDQVTANRSFDTDLSAGFPKVRTRLPSTGRIRALIVPVDFPAIRGKDNPVTFFTPLANSMSEFYLKQSYGKLAFDFSILPSWVRLPFPPGKYGFTPVYGSGDYTSYRNDIIAMTEAQIDYGQYDAVYFLVPKEMPMSQMSWGPAITQPTFTKDGYIINGATGGADMYLPHLGPDAQWHWMAHETGHAFGLYDEDLRHQSQTLGSWGLMANAWSHNAIEHNAWDRYLQGWLPESQVACLPRARLNGAGTTVTLSPLVRQNTAVKVAMVPLSDSKMLAIESRKNEGYDHIIPEHEGVLVYTIDMTVGQMAGGYQTQRRADSTDPLFEDAALHAGDSVTVGGVTVAVTSTSADGDVVKISAQ